MTRARLVPNVADRPSLNASRASQAKSSAMQGFASGVSLSVLAGVLATGGGSLVGDATAHAQTLTGQQTTTITLSGTPLVVDTAPAFGVVTDDGPAIVLNGTDGATFTDANASTIEGSSVGVFIRNINSGALTVTSNGSITGITSDGLQASSGGTGITLNVADVTGGLRGIVVQNGGAGAASITATGTVTGLASRGIEAVVTAAAGTGLTINAAEVSGLFDGITASNSGGGALSVTATGAVTGTLGRGIYGFTRGSGLAVSAASVNGGTGVVARNYGNGALSVTTTGPVTGTNGYGIFAVNQNSGTSLTINTAAVSGDQIGIFSRNNGSGALSITSTGAVSSTNRHGIYAINSYYSTDLTISTAAVSGGESGMYARNSGTGNLSITSTGDVTGGTGRGITARNDGQGIGLTINATAVTGTGRAIDARNYGSGAMSVTATGTVTGEGALGTAFGVYANNYNGTDLTVTTATVTGADIGIGAYNRGTGSASITATGTVTGTNGLGIKATSGSSAGDLAISTVDVSGGTSGIYARNYGEGALSVTSTGNVSGASGRGIFAYNTSASSNLTVSATTVSGSDDGIYSYNRGSGSLSISATGAVTGTGRYGIAARLGSNGSGITVSASDVSGGIQGIVANNNGEGAISVTATGTVTANNGTGIGAYQGNQGGSISISAATVSGTDNGIRVSNSGTGGISISATGNVVGQRFAGISSYRGYNGTSSDGVSISTASVTGGYQGIFATNRGPGALSITSTGTVTATNGQAIRAYNSNRGTDLTVSVGSASGKYGGISIYNRGSGATSITSTGPVTAAQSTGIYAGGGYRGTTLTISAAAVSGRYTGVSASHSGSGAMTVTTTGPVVGTRGNGVAINSNGASATLTVGEVTGGYNGIRAQNTGAGAMSITATGTVTGTYDSGIRAMNGYVRRGGWDRAIATLAAPAILETGRMGTDLTISTAAVSGGTDGIYALNNGTGTLSITTTGAVSGTNGRGIFAANGGTEVTDYYGYYGYVESIAVPAANRPGYTTYTTYAGTDLTVSTAAAVTGATDGIYARNFGTGALSISSTAEVNGTAGTGVYAKNAVTASDLTIAAAAVSGGIDGIRAVNGGTGALSITSTDAVGGLAGNGIFAENASTGTDLTITTAAVSGRNNGIVASKAGSGSLSVTAGGAVTGGTTGIDAFNGRSGTLSVTATGPVVGTTSFGVLVRNYGADATLKVGAVTGGYDGIRAQNSGTGALSITSTGAVTGTLDRGILALNGFEQLGRVKSVLLLDETSVVEDENPAATDLTIAAAAVSGNSDGIYAFNGGSGALSITTTGVVAGASGRGIFAANGGAEIRTCLGDTECRYDGIASTLSEVPANITYAGTSLTVSATAGVTGGTDGIYARNYGTGALSISATAAVSGANGSGVYAKNASSATGLTVTAGSVSGSTDGITAVNNGSGALTVSVSGTVTGGNGAGIATETNAGSTVAINLLSGASVSATSGSAIVDGAGNATVTIDGGAAVTGSIALGEGNDTLTLAKGLSLAGITTLDGGAGEFTDTLNLATQFDGSVSSWEVVNADTSEGNFALSGGISGADTFTKMGTGTLTISGTNSITGSTVVAGGRLNVLGSLASSSVILQNGTSLGGTGTVGSLTAQSGSTIAPGNSIGTLNVNGDLTLQAGSTLSMEISPTSVDMINVTGAATIAGNLVVIPEEGEYFSRTYTLINASSVTGTFDTSTFGSLGTAFRPTLVYTGTSVSLRLDPNSLVVIGGGTLTGNSLALAQSFDTAVVGGYNPQPFFDLYEQGANLAAVLPQFTGELHSAERRVGLQDSRVVRETAFDRLNSDFGEAAGTSSVKSEDGSNSKTIWMRVAGGWGKAKSNGVGARFTTDQAGFLMGADYANDTGFKLGGMFNYLKTDLNMASLGNSKIETIGGAFYAGYRHDASGLAIGAGWGMAHNTAKGNRAITLPGLTQTLRSTVNGTQYQLFGEAAYDLAAAENTRIEPFARIAYTVLDSKMLAETGGIAALNAGKQTNALTLSTFGLRGGYMTGQTTLTGSAGWQRTAGDRSAPTTLTMAGVNTPFVVESTALDRDALAVEAAANFSVSAQFNLSLGYSGLIGKKSQDHGARATARFEF